MIKPFYSWDYKMNENSEFDIPVGETFDYKGTALKVVCDKRREYGCDNCFFNPGTVDCNCDRLACLGDDRTDGKNVHFEEVKDDKTT